MCKSKNKQFIILYLKHAFLIIIGYYLKTNVFLIKKYFHQNKNKCIYIYIYIYILKVQIFIIFLNNFFIVVAFLFNVDKKKLLIVRKQKYMNRIRI